MSDKTLFLPVVIRGTSLFIGIVILSNFFDVTTSIETTDGFSIGDIAALVTVAILLATLGPRVRRLPRFGDTRRRR